MDGGIELGRILFWESCSQCWSICVANNFRNSFAGTSFFRYACSQEREEAGIKVPNLTKPKQVGYNSGMKPIREKNTKEKGLVEFIVYPDGDNFVGVCLTFDIVEEGNDPVALMESIKEAAQLHLDVVIKEDMLEELLNRFAPQEYWDKYFKALREMGQDDVSFYFQRNPYSQVLSVVTP